MKIFSTFQNSPLEEGENFLEQARAEKDKKNLKEAESCYQNAIKELEKAHTRNPVSRIIKATLAEAYCEQGDLLKAENFIDKAHQSYVKAQALNHLPAQGYIQALFGNTPSTSATVTNQNISPTPSPSNVFKNQSGTNVQAQGSTAPTALMPPSLLSHNIQTLSTKPKNTIELAQILIQSSTQDPNYPYWQKITLGVINEFAKNKVKTKANIQEITALAIIADQEIHLHLLNQGITALKESALLQPNLIQGLAKIIQDTDPALLNPDDLVQILKILKERLQDIHGQAVEKRFKMVYTISCLLDVMSDANVKGLNREKLHQPLYDSLHSLIKDPDPRLGQQAFYACQALSQVPHDENKLHAFMRRTLKAGAGVLYLAAAIKSFDPNKLVEAFKSFSEAFEGTGKVIDALSDTVKSIEKTKDALTTLDQGVDGAYKPQSYWYPALRYANLLIKIEQIEALKLFLSTVKCKTEKPFVFGLCQALRTIIASDLALSTRQWALEFLGEIYQNDKAWGAHEIVHKHILNILVHFASDSDKILQETTEKLLKKLSLISNKQKLFKEVVPKQFKPRKAKPKLDFPNDLLTIVQTKPFETLQTELENLPAIIANEIKCSHEKTILEKIKHKLEVLREETINDKDIAEELELYIPVKGAYSIQDRDPFDLATEVMSKQLTENKTLLLIGNTGSGKSTFGKFLNRALWKQYKFGDTIPIFIFLPGITQPETRLIEEHLNSCGFNEKEIEFLKENYSFNFILDAWDELKLEQRRNLHKSNHLSSWRASTVISCRSESLPPGNYKDMFIPDQRGIRKQGVFTEMTVVPFSPQQRQAYIVKYLDLHPEAPWHSVDEYEKHIKNIDGLEALVETPFLLMIAVRVMPSIVQKFSAFNNQQQRLKVTQTALYDEFINSLFKRQQTEKPGSATQDGHDIKEDYLIYSKKLAKAMYDKGLSYVDYSPASKLEKSKEPNIWEDFFGSVDLTEPDVEKREYRRLMVEARKGCPIRKIAANRWAFIHQSIQEYFYSMVYIEFTAKFKSEIPLGRALSQPVLSATHPKNPPLIFSDANKVPQLKDNNEVKEEKEKKEPSQLIEKASQMIRKGNLGGLKTLLSANPWINGSNCDKSGKSLSSIANLLKNLPVREQIMQLLISDKEKTQRIEIWV